MADVPTKLNYNESIRRIPEKVNEILDYLKRTRIQVDSRTMRKNETPAGITLSAQRQTVATPAQQLPGETAGEYTGYFKVVETTDESGKAMLKIIDGADPKSNYAGSTDLGYVPVMSIAKQVGQLYLLPRWTVQNDTRVYSFYLSYTTDPGEIRKAVKLASILGDGTIVQRHVTNEILWGNRFFV